MAKPILIIRLPNVDEADKNYISKKINTQIPMEEYHRLLIFGDYEEPSFELLKKGRHHKTIKKLSNLFN